MIFTFVWYNDSGDNMNRLQVFDKEINYIKNSSYKEDVSFLINSLPEYFFEIPASSTGKYHPSYALGNGGLLRHTKAAVRMAYELLTDPSIGDKYTDREKDLMILGIILHDGLKSGKEKSEYTKFEHPLLASNFIKENKDNLKMNEEDMNFVCDVIESHMGPWNKDYDGNEVLPVPKTKYQNFVHMCDYLASRKFINVNFNEENKIID